MSKNWELIKSLGPTELEIYHIINGIWIIAREFQYKLTKQQVEMAVELYKNLMAMNLKWLLGQVEKGSQYDILVELERAVSKLTEFTSIKVIKEVKEILIDKGENNNEI